jgi:hypothetical protein
LTEIKDLLRDGDLMSRIVRSLGSSTVALFTINYEHGNERLKFAGTGTLAVGGEYHGILTAAHVWDVLKSAPKIAITRTDKINHRWPIDIEIIFPTALKGTTKWNEFGPDLSFLRIPEELVGAIEAFQVFEHLQQPPQTLSVKSLECWVAIGSPEELGTFTETNASLEINGSLVAPRYVPGTPDYYEFEVDTSGQGIPYSYSGFSGGGLWRVHLYSSPSTGKVDWVQRLKGVVFWQFPAVNGRRIIRCHGHESISSLIKTMKSGDRKRTKKVSR